MNISAENKLAQTSVNQIERFHKPTREEFKQKILSSRKPVIITGKMADWKALALWSVDYLNTVVGNKEIDILVSKEKRFTYDPEAGLTVSITKMKFTDLTDWIVQKKKADEYYYLQRASMKTSFPEVFPDIEIPDYIDKESSLSTNLWIGTGGNISQLHYDYSHNLLSQVRGRKRIVLFDPKQTSLLYPFPAHLINANISRLNIDQPDIDKFPKFQTAKYIECMLEPGEILFIPAFWWHQVWSFEQLNIAVNFWWNPNFKDFCTPTGRRLAAKIPEAIWLTLRRLAGQGSYNSQA